MYVNLRIAIEVINELVRRKNIYGEPFELRVRR